MDIAADIFGSYVPLCCMCAPTYAFFAIAVVVLIFYMISLRTSAKAEKLAAEQEEMSEEKAGSKE
jgi:hypothetical protein